MDYVQCIISSSCTVTNPLLLNNKFKLNLGKPPYFFDENKRIDEDDWDFKLRGFQPSFFYQLNLSLCSVNSLPISLLIFNNSIYIHKYNPQTFYSLSLLEFHSPSLFSIKIFHSLFISKARGMLEYVNKYATCSHYNSLQVNLLSFFFSYFLLFSFLE